MLISVYFLYSNCSLLSWTRVAMFLYISYLAMFTTITINWKRGLILLGPMFSVSVVQHRFLLARCYRKSSACVTIAGNACKAKKQQAYYTFRNFIHWDSKWRKKRVVGPQRKTRCLFLLSFWRCRQYPWDFGGIVFARSFVELSIKKRPHFKLRRS